MNFEILTIFPELFMSYLKTSIIGRAQQEKLININLHNIRVHATDKHKTVDDTPYGGGAGMVMKIEPIDKTLQSIKKRQLPLDKEDILNGLPPAVPFRSLWRRRDKGGKGGSNNNTTPSNSPLSGGGSKTVVLSARGQQFTQAKAQEYARLDQLTLICGRYEGIDQRVADHLADEEISIGPYVLNGGEVAAMVVIEAVSRLIPKVLGNPQSLEEESHAILPPDKGGKGGSKTTGEYPQYTKPAEYKGWKVPEVLLSGNHEEIKKWRSSQSKQSQ